MTTIESLTTPEIRTELPGPNAARMIERDERYTSPSYTRVYPLVVKRAEGAMMEDVDGNRFLDFNAGIAVCATGHCHPRVVQAIQSQAADLIHMSGTDFFYEPQAALAQKLAELASQSPRAASRGKKVFFTNSGTEAIEAAIKLARYHTGRQNIIAFYGAFHGRTMGSLSLTASKYVQRRGFAPFVPGVTHVTYPDPYRRPDGMSAEDYATWCIEQIETIFRRTLSPDQVAAIVVEPIQGEGGYIVPPPNFHPALKALAEKHGILYVADEVQAGMGRTGTMFASEQFGVEPDILCLAKGIASGMPLGAIVAREDVMTWPPGSHASTFGGNPICCAAALETIALLEEEYLANTTTVGKFLFDELCELQKRHDIIGDVRGRGLMLGVELVKDRATKERAIEARGEVVQACFRKGLLILGCGENTLRFSPPLMITLEQAETAIRILDDVLGEIA